MPEQVTREAIEAFRSNVYERTGERLSYTAVSEGLKASLPSIRRQVLDEVREALLAEIHWTRETNGEALEKVRGSEMEYEFYCGGEAAFAAVERRLRKLLATLDDQGGDAMDANNSDSVRTARPRRVDDGSALHDYLSTACLHGRHDRCRKTCKFCGAGCRCECHGSAPQKPCKGCKGQGGRNWQDFCGECGGTGTAASQGCETCGGSKRVGHDDGGGSVYFEGDTRCPDCTDQGDET